MRLLFFIVSFIFIIGYYQKTYLWVWELSTQPLSVCHQMIRSVLFPSYLNKIKSLESRYLLELKSLRNLASHYREKEGKLERLEEILNLQTELKQDSLVAQVIGLTFDFSRSRFIINRGRKDGLKSYLPVMCSFGIVGLTYVVGENKSEIILLIDPQFSMSVRFQNQRSLALLKGQKGQTCSLSLIEKSVVVQEGDPIVSSGIGGIFPSGLFVGSVLYSNRDSKDLYQTALLLPNVPFERIEEVLVLLPRKEDHS